MPFDPPLSHDRPCSTSCGHPGHLITCSDTCDCTPPPIPGTPDLS